jgi:hypothetical protein
VNIPTQAKIRLEWATRRIANSEVKRFGMEMAQCFPEQETEWRMCRYFGERAKH